MTDEQPMPEEADQQPLFRPLDGSGDGFFISPIGEPESISRKRSDGILKQVLRPSLIPKYIRVMNRADDYRIPSDVMTDVVTRIRDAALIVADLSDHNPNVFYELALAHALGKPTILIKSEDSRLPFDLVSTRTISYSNTIGGTERLCSDILQTAEAICEDPARVKENPVGRTIDLATLNATSDPEKSLLLHVVDGIEEIKRHLVVGRFEAIRRFALDSSGAGTTYHTTGAGSRLWEDLMKNP